MLLIFRCALFNQLIYVFIAYSYLCYLHCSQFRQTSFRFLLLLKGTKGETLYLSKYIFFWCCDGWASMCILYKMIWNTQNVHLLISRMGERERPRALWRNPRLRCENAHNARVRRASLSVTWRHDSSTTSTCTPVRQHQRPPQQRAGPARNFRGGCDRCWLVAPGCDWQVPLRLSCKPRLLWLSEICTAPTDNGGVIPTRPRTEQRRSPKKAPDGPGGILVKRPALRFGACLVPRAPVTPRPSSLLVPPRQQGTWQRSGELRAPSASKRTPSRWRRWSEQRRDAGRPARRPKRAAARTERTSLVSRGRGPTERAPATGAARPTVRVTDSVSTRRRQQQQAKPVITMTTTDNNSYWNR